MKTRKTHILGSILTLVLAAASASAKDKPITFEECPAPVQTVIRHYQTQGTLEEIGVDENKKSGRPAVYEAKFALKEGRRIEIHIAADGSVVKMEEKKAKN